MRLQPSSDKRRRTVGVIFPLLVVLVAVLALFAGCAKDNDGGLRPHGDGLVANCEGCHSDKDMLIATAEPDTATVPESSGEG